MATEGPLIHDGGQCIAGADFRNSTLSGTTHAGDNGSYQFMAVHLSTVADRTVLPTTVAGQVVYGILQNKPNVGNAADIGIFGITKAVAGAAITAGATLAVDSSGCMVSYSSASGINKIGVAIDTVAAAGNRFTMALYGFGGNVGGNT